MERERGEMVAVVKGGWRCRAWPILFMQRDLGLVRVLLEVNASVTR